ncbi:MAG: hypothetical protein B6242_10270 [Anaerolineaceae bacterium 4572_78]|nr:MAG: hypothetical protein B6242_10270 [Anaerolineaceae bacterium 4572_78]
MIFKFPPSDLPLQHQSPMQPMPTYFSLVDLGMDTIKVAVVESGQDEINVLGHGVISAKGRNIIAGRAEMATLTAQVNNALQTAEDGTEKIHGYKVVPDHVIFALPNHALVGKQFTVNQRRTMPKAPITNEEMNIVWERIIRLARRGLMNMPNVNDEWHPQTANLAGLWIDNHRVNDLLGLSGTSISLSIYAVSCQPAWIQALEKLAEWLELEIFLMVAASQSLATIVPTKNALVFNIGVSGTDCYMICHDTLHESRHVALGGGFFTVALRNTFGCDFQSAEALKLAFSAGTLSQKDIQLVEHAFEEPFQRWVSDVSQTISVMCADRIVPHDIYFVGGGAVLPNLDKYLLSILKTSNLNFEHTPHITYLGNQPLKGFTHDPVGFRGVLFAPVLSLAKTVMKKTIEGTHIPYFFKT